MVIGVSVDSLESHRKFAKQHKLPFPLLSDADKSIAKAYGVTITPGGFHERVTFVIDEQGTIAKVYPAVKVSKHADEVLDACVLLDKD